MIKITPKLESIINAVIKQTENFKIITEETVKKAIKLVDYFNKNKLGFAKYTDINFDNDFFVILLQF